MEESEHQGNTCGRDHQGRPFNATDAFVQSMGVESLSLEADLADHMMDRMIDEVPVVEVDRSFFDPVSGLAAGASGVADGDAAASVWDPSRAAPSDAVIMQRQRMKSATTRLR